ncbi:hypothetical protein K2X30_13000 [bacterium]|nr:hypothetical protein [bacterium]
MNTLVTWVLALGILPSFTALSTEIIHAYPGLGKYLGPLNPLKIALPILIGFVWLHRKAIPKKLTKILVASFAIGSVASVIAALGCQTSVAIFYREWFVMIVGCLAGICFLLLPRENVKKIVLVWAVIVFGSGLLEVIAPSSIQWLYAHLFDPNTQEGDFREVGRSVLTGVFGRQSMAKLLSWIPWLLVLVFWNKPRKNNRWVFVFGVLAFASILGTSQRGPFGAALCGLAVFAAHQFWINKNKRHAVWGVGAIGATVVLSFILVPQDIWSPRVKSLVGAPAKETDRAQKVAEENIDIRREMWAFSFRRIAMHPLGNACITSVEFNTARIPMSHSHNIILEQFRSRGFIWGTVHFALWILACWGAWHSKGVLGSALSGALATVLVGGMVDHPWWVLNHAMVLGIFFVSGLWLWARKPKEKNVGLNALET